MLFVGSVSSLAPDLRVKYLLRYLAPHVLSAVARRYRDFASSEDAVQEALIAAGAQWPRSGVPNNLVGWLVQVAQRRMVDEVRSEISRRNREAAELVATVRGRCQGHRAVGLPRSDDPAGGKWRDDLPSVIRWRQTDKPNLNQFRRPNAPLVRRGVSFCDLSQPANLRRVGASFKGC